MCICEPGRHQDAEQTLICLYFDYSFYISLELEYELFGRRTQSERVRNPRNSDSCFQQHPPPMPSTTITISIKTGVKGGHPSTSFHTPGHRIQNLPIGRQVCLPALQTSLICRAEFIRSLLRKAFLHRTGPFDTCSR